MKIDFNKDLKILISYGFLIGLTVLLLNDFILKGLYGNWMTGKLSDFAGLFIFPLFWTAIFPKNKNKIFWLTAFFFVFWKSPYSQSFIETWNNYLFLNIHRVVDFTDLVALVVLPLAYDFETRKKNIKTLKINPAFPLALALFSFLATSLPVETEETDKAYSFDFPKDTLAQRIFNLPTVDNYFRDHYLPDSTGSFLVSNDGSDTVTSQKELLSRFIQDTMELHIRNEFCTYGYAANIIISGDDQASALNLIGFMHRCGKEKTKDLSLEGKDDKEKLINSFENKIIKKLKN